MVRRLLSAVFVVVLVMSFAACHNKKVSNPIANVDSKQPDKVLFDRAMDMLKHNRYDQARLTLQTLINTYPDSEFLARAKLGVADSWYAEGGTAAWAQAEAEYNDFRVFYPNMPEAAEAQMKIGNIHYQQMEKPDRDFTHAKRAEDAYRQMITDFPDSKLLPEAKERLREVQEVLAEREFRIGRFYYLRQSWAASVARLKSLTDTYPLYSQADEALYMIGDAYEQQAHMVRNAKVGPGFSEVQKAAALKQFEDRSADAYSRIVTRYPVTPRAEDAKKRLAELKRPIPTPTPEMIAQNKAEEASRQELGMRSKLMLNFHRRPDVAQAARVGDPSLADPKPTNAPALASEMNRMVLGGGNESNGSVSLQTAGGAAPGPNQPAPRSDAAQPATQGTGNAAPASSQASTATQQSGATTGQPDQIAPAPAGIGELTPMTSAPGTTPTQTTIPQPDTKGTNGSTEAAPSTPAPPPAQMNDINNAGTSTPAATGNGQATDQQQGDNKDQKESSSKKKKKKLGVF